MIIFIPSLAAALPRKGFSEGPYLRIIGGGMSVTFDDQPGSGRKIGNNFEGVYGFQFGWHLWDHAAAELQGRYSTRRVQNNREHIVIVNLNIKYNFVTNALTNIMGKPFHILPFVSGGPTALIAAVPGNPASSTSELMKIYGGGVGGTVGIDFLVIKYLYLGIMAGADIHCLTTGYQTVGGARTQMTRGGWQPTFSVLGAVGVHF